MDVSDTNLHNTTPYNDLQNRTRDDFDAPEMVVAGLITVLLFYAIIFAVGIYASWLGRKRNKTTDDVMLAGRNIGVVMGAFTMTATWVGGGFINGTAEMIFKPGYGLVWTQAPFGYALSLIIGGIFFARQMRERGYVTMLDPFEEKFGQVMTGFLYIPALLGEIFWCGAVLSALGSSLSVILGMNHTTSVLVSAGIAVFYTVVGGLYSVSYTDVVQLICIFIGLWLGVGFSLTNSAVSPLSESILNTTDSWVGEFNTDASLGLWIDSALLLIFGGIPWQAFFQRVLAVKVPKHALSLCIVAGFGCLFLAVPPILLGIIAKSTDWSKTEYHRFGPVPIPSEDYKLILPMVLRYLCPMPVALLGLGAVSAAVMSSADSSILSASTMFAKNIYKPVRDALSCGRQSSEREIIWVMRIAVMVVGAAASVMAISVTSIYALFYLCADLTYTLLFPQFLCVVHVSFVNTYGSLAGYIVGLFLRIAGGEILLDFDPLIRYPGYDEELGQLFPYKTFAMLMSLMTIIVTSLMVRFICAKRVPEEELVYKLMMRSAPRAEPEPPTPQLRQQHTTNEDGTVVMTSYRLSSI